LNGYFEDFSFLEQKKTLVS